MFEKLNKGMRKMMKTFYKYWIRPWTMVLLVALVQGCSTVDVVVSSAFPSNERYGYADYDPCVRCGESMVTYIHVEEDAHLWQQNTQEEND